MSRDVTSIEIKKTTWKTLNRLKEPGDSFDDVLQQLLHAGEESSGDAADGQTCPDCGQVFDSVSELLEHDCPER